MTVRSSPVAVLVVAGLAVALTACGGQPDGGLRALPDVETTTGINELALDDIGYFGLGPLGPFGDLPVSLRSVEVLDVPEPVEIVSSWAIRYDENPESVGAMRMSFRDFFDYYVEHPIDQVVLEPAEPGSTAEEWQIVIAARAREPGEYLLGMVRVHYTVAGEERYEDYPYHLLIRAIGG